MPEALILALLAIGISLLIFSKRKLLGGIFAISGIAVLVLFSNNIFLKYFIFPLTGNYHIFNSYTLDKYHIKNSNINYIVILAEGENLLSEYLLSKITLERLVTGVLLYKKFPGKKIILSAGGSQKHNTMESMKKIANNLGVPSNDIIIENISHNTIENALCTKPFVKSAPFLLVTSLYHIHRAMFIFKAFGMYPIPAPVEKFNPNEYSYIVSSDNFSYSTLVFHEYLSLFFFKNIYMRFVYEK